MPNSKPKRTYAGTDAGMLVAGATITENATRHQRELADADATLSTATIAALRARIDDAACDILGADNAAALRQQTQTLTTDTDSVLHELGLTKTLIETKYAADHARREELLNTLGFSSLYAKAGKRNQEAIGELLSRFNTNLTRPLETELTAKGLPATRIAALRNYAATYMAQNVAQETQKDQKKELNAADLTELNAIYAEVIGLCKIGQRVFHTQPAIRDGFVYEKALPGLRGNNGSPTPPIP